MLQGKFCLTSLWLSSDHNDCNSKTSDNNSNSNSNSHTRSRRMLPRGAMTLTAASHTAMM